MPGLTDSTLPAQRIPVLVVISPGPELLSMLEDIARKLDEVPTVKSADVASAATVLAEWRPFAVIIPEPVFAFDSQEFGSIAHSVGAELVVVNPEDSADAITARLVPRLKEIFGWWQARQAVSP